LENKNSQGPSSAKKTKVEPTETEYEEKVGCKFSLGEYHFLDFYSHQSKFLGKVFILVHLQEKKIDSDFSSFRQQNFVH